VQVRQQHISFHKEGVSFRLPNRASLEKWIELVIQKEHKTLGPISFVYCSDAYLRKINFKYLNINELTDVIAFEYDEGTSIGGDVFISVDRVRDNSGRYRIGFHDELRRVMVHAVLHLLGYRDKTPEDKATMTGKEDLYLSLHPAYRQAGPPIN